MVPSLRRLSTHLKGNGGGARVLAIDPGETSGWAYFEAMDAMGYGQIPTGSIEIGLPALTELFERFTPNVIVVEDYRVYAWRAKEHIGSDLHTARLIGAIEVLCVMRKLPLVKQSAHMAKGFCTDEKLREWELWQPGQPHARDAIRHCIYFLLFNKGKKK